MKSSLLVKNLFRIAALIPLIVPGFMLAPASVNAGTHRCIYGEDSVDDDCEFFAFMCNSLDGVGTSFPGGQICDLPSNASSRNINKLRQLSSPKRRKARSMQSVPSGNSR